MRFTQPPQSGHPSISGGSKSTESTTTLVHAVFRTVWNEYYAWEQEYSRKAISSLAKPLPTKTERASIVKTVNKNVGRMQKFKELRGSSTNIEALKVSPYPTYEACAPTSSNIWRGDDSPHMPFVPYADDPDFDQIEHSMAYDDFEWQNGNRDPDR
jgi:hypothetical protein